MNTKTKRRIRPAAKLGTKTRRKIRQAVEKVLHDPLNSKKEKVKRDEALSQRRR